jgi:hypothetical protein
MTAFQARRDDLRTEANRRDDNNLDGAPETNRTSDLPLRRGLLYPLSYRGQSGIVTANAGRPEAARDSGWE